MAGGALRTAFALTWAILIVEAIAGYIANSLALLSDAGHILTDIAALGLAWYAMHLSALPADRQNTFGYRRSGILAALANAALLVVVAVVVIVEAAMRLRHPEHVTGGLVVFAAVLAILVNTYIAFTLQSEQRDNLNVRAALLHVFGDIGASAGVILSGIVILLWHIDAADPIISLAIAALIAYGAWQIVRDTVAILMESTPRGIELDAVMAAMREVPGVEDVHDLHVWSLSDGFRLLSAHIAVPDQSLNDVANILEDLKMLLHRRFHIEHATIEPECVDCRIPRRRVIELHGSKDAAR